MKKSLTYRSESDLLNGLRNGAAEAFELLYRQYFRMVAKQVSDAGQTDAEDLFQEVLVILVRKVREPDFQLTAKLSTYLYAIARNLTLKKAGEKSAAPVEEKELIRLGNALEPDDPAERAAWEEQLNLVIGCLEILEETCQTLLHLVYFEKRSHAEIASRMGYTESFVKVKKHRCLEYLRKQVKEHPLFKDRSNEVS